MVYCLFIFSNQTVSLAVQGDYPHQPPSLPHMLENVPQSDGNISPSIEQSKEEMQLPQAPQNPAVLNGPNYGLGILSHMGGNQLVQLEGHESQAHEIRVPNFAVSCSILFLFNSCDFVIFFFSI